MNIQENSWKISLGLIPVPEHLYNSTTTSKWIDEEEVKKKPAPKNPYYKSKMVHDMCIRIREVIKRKIFEGNANSKHQFFYDNLRDCGMLTYPNGKLMSLTAVQKHIAAVKESLGMPKRTDKGKEICRLFDGGMSEKDISVFLDTNPTTVYYALLRSGRITNRPRSKKIVNEHGKNKKDAIKNLNAQGYSVEQIAEILNTDKYYVQDCLSGKA